MSFKTDFDGEADETKAKHRGFPSPSVRIVPSGVPILSFSVVGTGFEPGQPVQITFDIKSGSSDTFTQGNHQIASDPSGNFSDSLNAHGSVINSASVLAFDFGSGEVAKASFG
jgi:hypothetical protein